MSGVRVCVCPSMCTYLTLDCISRENSNGPFSHSHLIRTIRIIRIIINKHDLAVIASGNGDYSGIRRGGSKLKGYSGKDGGRNVRFEVASGGHLKGMGG